MRVPGREEDGDRLCAITAARAYSTRLSRANGKRQAVGEYHIRCEQATGLANAGN